MPRDPALEKRVSECLAEVDGLTRKPMFGGFAWMKDGHLLCAARRGGVMIRLGKGKDSEALQQDGVTRVMMRGRPMSGWVRVTAEVFADIAFAKRIIGDALSFVRSLPAKF